jgi:hypothetical protein
VTAPARLKSTKIAYPVSDREADCPIAHGNRDLEPS